MLYYICGYTVRKLKVASATLKKLRNMCDLIEVLITKEPCNEGSFVKNYQMWAEKQNRGGLLFVVPNFYLLVREFDSVYRQSTSYEKCGKALTVSKIVDSFMVQFYWNKIVDTCHVDEISSLPALDYLVNLFITIKGFAVARKERDRLTKKVVQTEASSKSLTGKLKTGKGEVRSNRK